MHRVEFVRFKTLIYVAIYSFPPFNFQQLGEKLWIFLRNDCKTRPSSQQSDVNESIFNRVWHFFCVCVCLLSWSSYPNSSNKDHLPFGECCKPLGLGDDTNCPGLWMRHPKLGTNKKRPIFEKAEKKHPWRLEFHGFNFRGCVYGDFLYYI